MYSLGVSTDYTAEKGILGGLANQDAQTVTPTSICDSQQSDDIDIGGGFVINAAKETLLGQQYALTWALMKLKHYIWKPLRLCPSRFTKLKKKGSVFPVKSTRRNNNFNSRGLPTRIS